VWARWVRVRQLLRTWAERVWTYLWDGPPEGEADESGGAGAGAYETEVSCGGAGWARVIGMAVSIELVSPTSTRRQTHHGASAHHYAHINNHTASKPPCLSLPHDAPARAPNLPSCPLLPCPLPSPVLLQPQVLENSISKIGALLAIGFGDAGAEVIAENIRNDGDINPMVPGRRTVAIFGFCDIRRFTDTTEVLQVRAPGWVGDVAAACLLGVVGVGEGGGVHVTANRACTPHLVGSGMN
jgi:hypothetical protein